MVYLSNTFSVSMTAPMKVGGHVVPDIERISAKEAGRILREADFVSAFGHVWSAWHLSRYLKADIPVSRNEIRLTPEDVLIVAHISNVNRWTKRVDGLPKWEFYRVKIRENS